ncbi:ABC transporter permease [Colwellia psychrerythraea]|uniref:MacB-like periplasmic core domain containing protein n=1 Tax=Colwellia psychrerythraea TaxID=28229 RepID=A0A099L1N7_COLPS|nr:FtsX-like permease family protein [Colwellia psychrerythraea]KGJ96756.1 MacB-like periplasmic core domain containing protein [Colwellia psychrerythraea]
MTIPTKKLNNSVTESSKLPSQQNSAQNTLVLLLAKRSIFRNTRRTLLTVLLISCSLAAILFTDAFVRGMVETMVKISTQTFLGEGQIHRVGFRETNDVDLYIEDTTTLYQQLNSIVEIEAFSPRVLTGAMTSSSENVASAIVYGVDAIKEAQVSKLKLALVQGDYLSGIDGEIIIGEQLADLLEISLGDRLVVTVSEAHAGDLSQALFRVSGLFRFNERSMDIGMTFINLSQAQKLLNINGVHEIALRLQNLDQANDKSLGLWQTFNNDIIETLSWQELIPQLSSMLAMTKYSTLIVSIIMYILVCLGLINTMFMSIFERQTEFGILLAIGTRPKQLFYQIMLEGFFIGVLSVTAGLFMAFIFCYWGSIVGIDYSELEMSGMTLNEPIYLILDVSSFASMALATLAVTLLASLYPAFHAAALQPSFAMRKTL